MTSEEQNKVKRMKIKDAMRLDINYKKKTNMEIKKHISK